MPQIESVAHCFYDKHMYLVKDYYSAFSDKTWILDIVWNIISTSFGWISFTGQTLTAQAILFFSVLPWKRLFTVRKIVPLTRNKFSMEKGLRLCCTVREGKGPESKWRLQNQMPGTEAADIAASLRIRKSWQSYANPFFSHFHESDLRSWF